MARLFTYLIGLVLFVVLALVVPTASELFAIFTALAVGFLVPLLDAMLTNASLFRIAWYSLRNWNGRVRISASYLYLIRLDDEYLLIKGQRFDHFQPVGGVYKTHPSSYGERNRLGMLDDNLLKPDQISEGDLRVRVPGRRLVAFVRWFESGRGREVDGWREFYEELVATGILPGDDFRYVNYDHAARIYRPLRYSQWAESKELLIADVLELLPTPEQLAALRDLRANPHPEVLWATESQIRRLGATDRSSSQITRIAETATWTIDANGAQ